LTIYQLEARAKDAGAPPDPRFDLVRVLGTCQRLIPKHAGETERDQAGEAGHEAAHKVREECKAEAIFETILETIEASEWESAFKAILKSTQASRHEARIDDRAPKSRREPGMGAWMHPMGHSVVRTTSRMLGVSLAGHPKRPNEG
jgi:hypothetical protein